MNGWSDIPCETPVAVTIKGCEDCYPEHFIAKFIGTDGDLLVLNVEHVWKADGDVVYDAFPPEICRLATFEEVLYYDVQKR